MYTTKNYKTKKQLKQDVKDGVQVHVFQPGPFAENAPTDGVVFLEGPHYPEPHRWYAKAVLKDGIVVKVQ